MTTITESARKQMEKVAIKNDVPYIRYSLDAGGCSGLFGNWKIETIKEDIDTEFELGNDKSFLLDSFTLEYLENAIIDYAGDFMPSFKVSIPGATSCGCGESFVNPKL